MRKRDSEKEHTHKKTHTIASIDWQCTKCSIVNRHQQPCCKYIWANNKKRTIVFVKYLLPASPLDDASLTTTPNRDEIDEIAICIAFWQVRWQKFFFQFNTLLIFFSFCIRVMLMSERRWRDATQQQSRAVSMQHRSLSSIRSSCLIRLAVNDATTISNLSSKY